MAGQVKMFGMLAATGFDLAPGKSDFWATSGLGYGRWASYAAIPLSLLGVSRSLTVPTISHSVDAAGNRTVNVEVRNDGTEDAIYGLFLIWTDLIP